jgi:hypothetical protein
VSGDVATVVASDHHGDHRPDEPSAIHTLVSGLAGGQRADLLMRTNPARIRAGLAVESGDALGRTA